MFPFQKKIHIIQDLLENGPEKPNPDDYDMRHVALNSYDYRCLRYEIELFKSEVENDNPIHSFESLCPTLAGIVAETESQRGMPYPVRDTPYDKVRNYPAYQLLRLLDEILYHTEEGLSKEQLMEEVRVLAASKGISLPRDYEYDPTLKQSINKRLGELRQLIDVEFNLGRRAPYERGSFGQGNRDWKYPLMFDDEYNERVTAFKMTVSMLELIDIIGEMTCLIDVYFEGNDSAFARTFPLLAALGNPFVKKGFFRDENLSPVPADKIMHTVKYSSYYSSIPVFSHQINDAINNRNVLDIYLADRTILTIYPKSTRTYNDNPTMTGLDVNTRENRTIELKTIRGITLSNTVYHRSFDENEEPVPELEEVDITLTINRKNCKFLSTKLERLNIKKIHESYYYDWNADIERRKSKVNFKASLDYTLFQLLDYLHRNGYLYDIEPVEVKDAYLDYWKTLKKSQAYSKYHRFNW